MRRTSCAAAALGLAGDAERSQRHGWAQQLRRALTAVEKHRGTKARWPRAAISGGARLRKRPSPGDSVAAGRGGKGTDETEGNDERAQG
jgi:hypothetical protein